MNALKELFSGVVGDPDALPEIAATAKAATPVPAPVVHPPELSSIEAAIAELATTMTSLTKAVRTQRVRLDEVCNATPESRQVNLDKAARETAPAAEPEFSWSIDMNRPLGRDNVPVEKQF